ncbi:Pentatricopeptide repeat-containing protein [Quillaja saponaria]|uniref:Pentatricopeptide repeat-containing protein n=1 Tax=Quillaja saponaria TaxID=32244 RepID=A0AAD7VI94_QUISA|nr:Pentatricopeptide repeat-containing protein [Quillaja saponaria]
MKLKYHNLTAELSSTSSWLLHSCKHHRTAKQIHASLIVSTGLLPASISSKLMSLYARFNDLESVIWVFNSLHEQPNTMMWNLIIRSHVDLGHLESAISLYRKMRELGVAHDSFTFPIINQAISSIQREVIYGEMIHCLAIHMGFDQDLYFCNTMIEVYVKCGCVICARQLFDVMLQRDLVSWTSMISGYVSARHVAGACHLFNKMTMGLKPNSVTMIVMLQACCASGTLIGGTQVRGYAVKSGLSMDGSVQNSVLKMYTQLGSTEEVERFFSEIQKVDVVSWNTIISFYSMNGDIEKVVDMFIDMHSGEVLSWNIETLTVVISAFAKHGNVSEGESLHCLVIKTGLCDHVLLTSLLDFYAKCGKLEVSIQLFKEIHYRSSVTWGAVMSGLVQNGYFVDAINLFQQMQVAHLDPEPDTLRNLVDAYANLGALKLGKAIHGHLIRSTVYSAGEDIAYLETSVLNMYIRCGNISSAIICFDAMSVKDVVAWTTMIEGFGSHGFGYEALKYFNLMMEQRVEPNAVTFLSLLSACSHSGLVSEGSKIFHSMKWIFGIEPGLDSLHLHGGPFGPL